MCDALPDVIYNTPVELFRDRLPDWLADDAVQADVLDAVMQVLAASDSEADVKLLLAACREHCTPQPSLTQRLLSAMSESSVAAHKCLIIEQLPHFCTSTAAEVSSAISACSSEYTQQPALRLPIIAALAAMHIPQSCQQQLVAYINDALESASPSDYSTLLRSALRCLPLASTLPILQTVRRLSLTVDCGTAGQLLHTLLDVRAVSGDKVIAWVEAVDGSRGEVGVMDVLVLLALLIGGEEEEEDRVWRCLSRCVAAERLTLRRLRDVLSRPWLDVLSSYVPALGALCRRLVSSSDQKLREWARQLLPGVFVALPASQMEMRRVLLSGCSKSYQSQSTSGVADAIAADQNSDERSRLFHRAEVCADTFLRIAHAAPAALVPHLSYLDSVMDFPDALYPLVLHRLAAAIGLTIAASPAAASHANRLVNELTKLLTMGNAAGRKTALIVASHLIRAVGIGRGGDVECGWAEGLMRRSVAVLSGTVRAVVEAVSRAEAGVSRMEVSSGGELISDAAYVLDGEWNVSCVALDAICLVAHHLPTALRDSAASTIKQALANMAVLSLDVPISLPSHPSALFAHQLPSSLLSHLHEPVPSSATARSPILLVHSFYLSATQRSNASPLRLSFLPLLYRSHLTCLASTATASCHTASTEGSMATLAPFLTCAYELPAAAAGDALPTDSSLLLDVGLCAVIAYQCCWAAIEVATGASHDPSLSRPLLTALSTLYHLLDLALDCDKQLRARAVEWREQPLTSQATTPTWLLSAPLFHEAVGSLPQPDPLLLSTVLHFSLSPTSLSAASATSSSAFVSHPPLLQQLYQSAYRPAASPDAAGLFTDTGFFSLLHIALRSIQLLLARHSADPFNSLSSSVFLSSHTAVRASFGTDRLSASASLSSSSSSASSSSLHPSSSHAFSATSFPVWPLLSPALHSLVLHCSTAGQSVLPLDVLLLHDGCLPAMFASLEALCGVEHDNRREQYVAPPSAAKPTKRRTVAPSIPASPTAPKTTVAPPSGKEEQAEDEELLVTPFQQRKRGRRKQQAQLPVPEELMPMVAVEGPAATVSFVLPDQSSQLVVADCLSLLSAHICHLLRLALARCLERQALDEREWTLTWQSLLVDMARPTPSTSLTSSPVPASTASRSFFTRLSAVALRHSCSSTSIAAWTLARAAHALDVSLSLPSGVLRQLQWVYPHNQLLATCVSLHLVPLPTSAATLSSSASFLSNLSIRSSQLSRLFDAAVRAFLAHCARHITKPPATGVEGAWSELVTPLQSGKLVSGLHGDDWTLHWLLWQYCESAHSSHVARVVEWLSQCMYEVLEGDSEADEDGTEQLKHKVALTGHPVLATLTTASFPSYLLLSLLLTQLQLAKLQPSTGRSASSSFATAFHRALLVYCHLLQLYLHAVDIAAPPQRLHLSPGQPSSSSSPPSARQSKRARQVQSRPLCATHPSCNASSTELFAAHSAVLSSFVFVSRLLRLNLPIAVSGEVHVASSGALHSRQLLDCVNLCLYASEQAESINAYAPVAAAPARVGRKRKSAAAAAASSDSSSTSLQLLKSVELLRATVDSLMAPYGYTLHASPEQTANTEPSPLPPLPRHSLPDLIDGQLATTGVADEAEHEDVEPSDEEEEEEDEEAEQWSDEGDDSDESDPARPHGAISRFHQRMEEPRVRREESRTKPRKRSAHSRTPRHTLFDSTDEEEDEDYVAVEGAEQEEDGKEHGAEVEEETAEAGLEMEEKGEAQQQAEDDDIESGKDEADDERV